MRLIDADIAYASLSNYYHHKTEEQHKALKEALDRVITVDVEPMRHGRWTDDDSCTACGWEPLYDEIGVVGMPYCPNCGAKMDEEKRK